MSGGTRLATYFSRVPMGLRPALEEARRLIPREVSRVSDPRFLCGVSPHFVGLHYEDMTTNWPLVADRGWTYENCAHASFAHRTSDDRPTIVLPRPDLYRDPVGTILHECGHLFDEATGFHLDAPETTEYSRSNRLERVAEAFELILRPPTGLWEEFCRGEAMRPLRTAMGIA